MNFGACSDKGGINIATLFPMLQINRRTALHSLAILALLFPLLFSACGSEQDFVSEAELSPTFIETDFDSPDWTNLSLGSADLIINHEDGDIYRATLVDINLPEFRLPSFEQLPAIDCRFAAIGMRTVTDFVKNVYGLDTVEEALSGENGVDKTLGLLMSYLIRPVSADDKSKGLLIDPIRFLNFTRHVGKDNTPITVREVSGQKFVEEGFGLQPRFSREKINWRPDRNTELPNAIETILFAVGALKSDQVPDNEDPEPPESYAIVVFCHAAFDDVTD